MYHEYIRVNEICKSSHSIFIYILHSVPTFWELGLWLLTRLQCIIQLLTYHTRCFPRIPPVKLFFWSSYNFHLFYCFNFKCELLDAFKYSNHVQHYIVHSVTLVVSIAASAILFLFCILINYMYVLFSPGTT